MKHCCTACEKEINAYSLKRIRTLFPWNKIFGLTKNSKTLSSFWFEGSKVVLDALVHRLRFFKQNNDERTVCQCSLIKMHAFKSVACHSETNDNEVN